MFVFYPSNQVKFTKINIITNIVAAHLSKMHSLLQPPLMHLSVRTKTRLIKPRNSPNFNENS